jgi:uncharacterized membrane protein
VRRRLKSKHFLKQLDHDRIVAAIREAEGRSRGELRVHVVHHDVGDVEQAAARQFEAFGMTATAERTGVLIYVAPRSRKFAVIGDTGIHARCGPGFWKDVAAAMESEFREGRFTDGIVKGLARAGDALAEHFPRTPGGADANELPDEVTEE